MQLLKKGGEHLLLYVVGGRGGKGTRYLLGGGKKSLLDLLEP